MNQKLITTNQQKISQFYNHSFAHMSKHFLLNSLSAKYLLTILRVFSVDNMLKFTNLYSSNCVAGLKFFLPILEV